MRPTNALAKQNNGAKRKIPNNNVNPLPSGDTLCRLLITFANILYSDTLMVFMKEVLKTAVLITITAYIIHHEDNSQHAKQLRNESFK